jgi:hypothetical protein
MLIVALVLAVVGLTALFAAVVTGNELIAWVCVGASGLGILLLIADAIRERSNRRTAPAVVASADTEVIGSVETTEVVAAVDESIRPADEVPEASDDIVVEDHPDELVHDDPDYDLPTDDEPDFPEPAEEAAIHIVDDDDLPVGDIDEDIDEDIGPESEVEESTGDVDDYATEVHYSPSAEGEADTVYTYSESAETEYIAAEESEVTDERRDR